jgi:hypothetical protein
MLVSFFVIIDARLLTQNIRPQSTAIAFYAYMTKNEQNTDPHHTLMFVSMETNVENGYNNNTGIFTAPEPGVYLFFLYHIPKYVLARRF